VPQPPGFLPPALRILPWLSPRSASRLADRGLTIECSDNFGQIAPPLPLWPELLLSTTLSDSELSKAQFSCSIALFPRFFSAETRRPAIPFPSQTPNNRNTRRDQMNRPFHQQMPQAALQQQQPQQYLRANEQQSQPWVPMTWIGDHYQPFLQPQEGFTPLDADDSTGKSWS
jgi:hypothetical protein